MTTNEEDIKEYIDKARENPHKFYCIISTYASASKVYTNTGKECFSMLDECHRCSGRPTKPAVKTVTENPSEFIFNTTATLREISRKADKKTRDRHVSNTDVEFFGHEVYFTPRDGTSKRRYIAKDGMEDGTQTQLDVVLCLFEDDLADLISTGESTSEIEIVKVPFDKNKRTNRMESKEEESDEQSSSGVDEAVVPESERYVCF
jgi:hypothetical protein